MTKAKFRSHHLCVKSPKLHANLSTMTTIKTANGRRSFLKSAALAGGGMMLGFEWLTSCQSSSNHSTSKFRQSLVQIQRFPEHC